MAIDEKAVRGALAGVEEPDLGIDVLTAELVRDLAVRAGVVSFDLLLNRPAFPGEVPLDEQCREALAGLPGLASVEIRPRLDVPRFQKRPRPRLPPAGGADPWAEQAPLPGVRNVVAVASGKGGVGKSTVAVNLAVALARAGAAVGLMDADVYGPSAPLMMGLAGRPEVAGERVVPMRAHGVRVMSVGFLVAEDQAMDWRGPLVQSAVRQLLKDVAWGELDYLVVDMPPGTGDAQLTLVQSVPLTGVVIVSTPQDVALIDARKGITMFRKAGVSILGVVENMSYFICDRCSARHELFASGGAEREAARQGVDFLGRLPLVEAVRVGGDGGRPIVAAEPESPVSLAFMEVARRVAAGVVVRDLRDPGGALSV